MVGHEDKYFLCGFPGCRIQTGKERAFCKEHTRVMLLKNKSVTEKALIPIKKLVERMKKGVKKK
jgi:hypothetical protein